MKRIGLFILCGILASDVFAGSQTGADFLKIPVGARGVAMGEAFTALASETDALNWNTAGIISQSGDQALNRFSLSHQLLFFGNSLNHAAVTLPRGNSGIGLSLTRLEYPDQEGRDVNRNVVGSFDANDMSLGLAYAAAYQGFRIGTQVKYLQQSIADQSATGFAMDLGLLSNTPWSRLTFGASVRNLGPSMQFISDRFNLPLVLSVGTAYQVKSPLLLAFDIRHKPYERQTSFSIGTEFSATEAFSLRAGYLAKLASAVANSQTKETNRGIIGGISGINAGFGLKLSRMNLDYAMTPFGELGDVHTLTFSTAFGRTAAPVRTLEDGQNRTFILFDQPEGESQWWQTR
jgi:hypothetical protein